MFLLAAGTKKSRSDPTCRCGVGSVLIMQLAIPTPLRKYTNGQRVVETRGATLREMLEAMERDYPGFRFRVMNEQGQLREHIKLFINQRIASDLDAAIQPQDEVRIILAISGG